MIHKVGIILGVLAFMVLAVGQVYTLQPAGLDWGRKWWTAETSVIEVLDALGEVNPEHYPADRSPELVESGRQLIFEGIATRPDGSKTRLQSRYFACTSCHNMALEDPDPRFSDPETRLEFAKTHGQPFLQGTTLYGTVNKRSWYNGDYFKKYGDLVKPANSSLVEAIQLCATVCSQGRAFDEWELSAVLAYLWSIDLKLGDLALSAEDWQRLEQAREQAGAQPDLVNWLKGFYRSGSPATFLEVPANKADGYTVPRPGDPQNGRLIYDLSCLHCHGQEGPSNYLKLDHSKLSLNFLAKKIETRGHLSLYEIVRHGTYAKNGHRAYMPHYTGERMSNQQLEDLRAYIESGGLN